MNSRHEPAIPLHGSVRLVTDALWCLVVLALGVLFVSGAIVKSQDEARGMFGVNLDTTAGHLQISPSPGFESASVLRPNERVLEINGVPIAAGTSVNRAVEMTSTQDTLSLRVQDTAGTTRNITLVRVPRYPNDLGISSQAISLYLIFWDVLLVASYFGLGILLFLRKSDDGLALLVSLSLILLALRVTTEVMLGFRFAGAWDDTVGNVFLYVGVASFPFLFALFPNGKFFPAWTRYYVVFGLAYAILVILAPTSSNDSNLYPWRWLTDILFVSVGVVAQVSRYRRVSTPLEKQQTKWLIFGIVISLLIYYGYLITFVFVLPNTGSRLIMTRYQFFAQPLFVLGVMAVSLTFAFSILRYRLWDIDVIIRRTLTYTLVTGLLLVVFMLSVILLQRVFALLTGGSQNELVTVLSTLAIAALFVPLRNRIQSEIDKRFNRRKYNAQQVLTDFAKTVRDETNLENLTARLMQVVDETMQPASVSVWLNRDKHKPHLHN